MPDIRPGAKTKARIIDNVTKQSYVLQYNPTILDYSRGSTFDDISSPGIGYPGTQFIKGNARSFSVEFLLYDRPATGIIPDFFNYIGRFLGPEINRNDFVRPADMTFCFGYFIRQCVLEDINIRIERFDENGQPTEAYITLQLRQVCP